MADRFGVHESASRKFSEWLLDVIEPRIDSSSSCAGKRDYSNIYRRSTSRKDQYRNLKRKSNRFDYRC